MGPRPLVRDVLLSVLVCIIVLVPPAFILYWLGTETKIFGEFKEFLTGKEIITGAGALRGSIGTLLIFLCAGLLICVVVGKVINLIFGISVPKNWKYEELPFLSQVISYLIWALVEEFVFRFGLINIFRVFFANIYGPVIISSIVFGLIHMLNYGDRLVWRVIPHVAAGLFLAFVFLKYGFWTAVIFHALYNISVTFVDRIYRWLFPNSHERYVVAFKRPTLRK